MRHYETIWLRALLYAQKLHLVRYEFRSGRLKASRDGHAAPFV